jgi:CubicO group peptidase (beta-lactamase class C family)
MMKKSLLLTLLLCAASLHASADYSPVVAVLEKFIEHEMSDKDLPALSIALVDDQRTVWSKGFGFANPKTKVPATADTSYPNPLGMNRAGDAVATGTLWTIDGRVFDAPPANGPYATVGDLGRYLSDVFAGRARMPEANRSTDGFAVSLEALPDEKLGVAVITTKYAANAVTHRIADAALTAMLAARQQKPIPEPEVTSPVDPQLARRIAGRYVNGDRGVDLIESGGQLSLLPINGGRQVSLRSLGDALIVDSPLSYGEKILLRGDAIVIGGKTLERVANARPHAPAASWTGLIGEYGPDHDILYILEKDNKLWALIDWFDLDPLEQVSANVFTSSRGQFVFTRDAAGRATGVTTADVVYPRRKVGPEEGASQLRITPVRPMADLLREALAAEQPKESGDFRTPDLVELTNLDPSIELEVRYATTNNFLGTVFYSQARAFLQRPAAEAVVRAHRKLKKLGYGLLVHDAYRPWYVTKMFWDATPDDKKLFVADPSQGSRHNRGCAVDLTLYESKSGKPVQMVSTYDETTDRAAADYPGGTSLQRWHRQVLREAMEAEGFAVYPAEWWHFDYRDWRSYPILNVRFENIGATPALSAAPPEDTDAYVARAMSAFGVPGLSLAIVANGRTVVARGYGVRSIVTNARVDEHTAFPIGSESKAFTTAALAILVDRGKLKWTDRVVDRLPGFQMYDPYVTEHMTVRDLLTHRSGLRLGQGDLLIIPNTNRSRADVVRALRYLKPATGFREQYAYDNVLYIAAGALVEAVSGQTWEDFVRQNIFVPLDMKDSLTNYDAAAPNGVALHARLDGPMRGLGTLVKLERGLESHVSAPAGGINLSAVDMAKWMAMLLDRGKLPGGKQLLSEEAVRTLWTPVVVTPAAAFPGPMALANPHLQAYALGWSVGDYRGHPVIQHTGAVLGALSALYLIPDKRIGIAVSINSEDTGARRAVLFHLLDQYLGLSQADWIGIIQTTLKQMIDRALEALRNLPPDLVPNDHSSLPMADYAGIYRDPWYGTVTVTDRGRGRLWITFDRTPGMEGELEHVADDTFRTRFTDRGIEDAYMTFTIADGRVARAAMRPVSPLADFSFDYVDLDFSPAVRRD